MKISLVAVISSCVLCGISIVGCSDEQAQRSVQPAEQNQRSSVDTPQTKSVADLSDVDASYYAEKECKSHLKSPSTAKFSSPLFDSDTKWSKFGFNQWIIKGHVDSQNEFGAMIRSTWGAVVSQTGNIISVDYLIIGNNEWGSIPARAVKPLSPEQIAAMKDAKKATEEAAKATNEIKHMAELQKILKFYTGQAATGDAYAQYRLGMMYLNGDGVAKDPQAARRLLDLAAFQDQPDAKKELAKLPPGN